jgi:DNA-binding NarL/FixJ family response regulator
VKILIVDDDPGVREMLDKMIRAAAAGREYVSIGESGSLGVALEWLRAFDPDIVLCDGEFPSGMTGELRNLPESDYWVLVWARTVSARKKFALLTGDLGLFVRAQAIGVPAFMKPEGVNAAIEFVLSLGRREQGLGT